MQALKDKGFQIQNRPAFNILYLAFNQENKALKDVKVRQAINHAIDKEALLKASLPPGSKAAIEFMPDLVNGYNPNVDRSTRTTCEKAKSLLKEAGQENLTLKFAYPTGVSRPYMPTPEDTFQVLKSQLEAAGIKITPVRGQVEPGLPGHGPDRGGREEARHPPAGLDRRLQRPGQLPGRVLRGEDLRVGLRQQEAVRRSEGRPRAADASRSRRRCTRRSARTSPSSSRACRWPTRRRRWPSPRACEGYVASPVQDEVWNNVTVTR